MPTTQYNGDGPITLFHYYWYSFSLKSFYFWLLAVIWILTRRTLRAQTSWAEADLYYHMDPLFLPRRWWMSSLCGGKLIPKVLDHYLHHDLIILQLIWCFCSFSHIRKPVSPSNLISSSLYHPGTVHKIHSNPFLSFWVMLSTNRRTDRQTNATKNITSLYQGGNRFTNSEVCKFTNDFAGKLWAFP